VDRAQDVLVSIEALQTLQLAANAGDRTENRALGLVHLLGFCDSLIDGFAAGKSFLKTVPVSDCRFPQFPAKQDGLAFHFAGKVKQADAKVLDLHASGVDFGESIFRLLFGPGTFRPSACQGDDIEKHPAIQKNAMVQGLQLGIGALDDVLGFDRRSQQRFEYR